MQPGGRRSPRLAEKRKSGRAARADSDPSVPKPPASKNPASKTSAAPTTNGGPTSLAAVVKKIEEDLEKRPPKRSQTQDTPPGSEDEEDDNGDDGSDDTFVSSDSSSESDEDSGKDPDELRQLWSYKATKELHRKSLPLPFKMSNPQVIKAPRLWPLMLDQLSITATDLVTSRGLDGEVTKCYMEHLNATYQLPDGGNTADSGSLFKLKQKLRIFGALYLAADDPAGLFEGACLSIMTEAETILRTLDGHHLSRVYGPAAGQSFRDALRLPLTFFPSDCVSAARHAMRKRSRSVRSTKEIHPRNRGKRWNGNKRPHDRARQCSQCGAWVRRGGFDEHNRVCPGHP